jgi:hypothetical protein
MPDLIDTFTDTLQPFLLLLLEYFGLVDPLLSVIIGECLIGCIRIPIIKAQSVGIQSHYRSCRGSRYAGLPVRVLVERGRSEADF